MLLDKRDPLDRLILQELQEKPVLFDEWEDALAEMDEQDLSVEELLACVQMTAEEVERAVEQTQKRVLELCKRYGLCGQSRMQMCVTLEQQAICTPEFIELLSLLLADNGLYFNSKRDASDTEQNISDFCLVKLAAMDAAQWLHDRCALQHQWIGTLRAAQKSSLPDADCWVSELHEIFQLCCDLFGISSPPSALFENLEFMLQTVHSNTALHRIKPLYIYQMLVKHGRRYRKSTDVNVNPVTLWKYTEYKIDKDNGKNFNSNTLNMKFFEDLCEICRKDGAVDLMLCGYGFDMLSNLGEFYRQQHPFESHSIIPLSVAEWVESFCFGCFAEGDAEIFSILEGDIDATELENFRESSEPRISGVLGALSAYMNQHAFELEERFRYADNAGVKVLCASILQDASLPARQQPRADGYENARYLGAIHLGLQQLAEGFAQMRLVQTIKKLTGEAVSL